MGQPRNYQRFSKIVRLVTRAPDPSYEIEKTFDGSQLNGAGKVQQVIFNNSDFPKESRLNNIRIGCNFGAFGLANIFVIDDSPVSVDWQLIMEYSVDGSFDENLTQQVITGVQNTGFTDVREYLPGGFSSAHLNFYDDWFAGNESVPRRLKLQWDINTPFTIGVEGNGVLFVDAQFQDLTS